MHAIITEGAFHAGADGEREFEHVAWWDSQALNELFRRMVLRGLREAERLHPRTEEILLGWEHSGFSVHATEPVLPDDSERLEHPARYITRAPIRLDAVRFGEDGRQLKVRTAPHRQTGRTEMELDPLELIRRVCAQIPAPRQHLVRYYGWYANRTRGARGESVCVGASAAEASTAAVPRRRSWARLLRRIFEVDPLLCPQCGVEMRPVSVTEEAVVVDRGLEFARSGVVVGSARLRTRGEGHHRPATSWIARSRRYRMHYSYSLDYGESEFELKRIVAITVAANESSIKLLESLGLRFEKTMQLSGDEMETRLYGRDLGPPISPEAI